MTYKIQLLMLKKMLFVDLFCPYGHINLNKVLIKKFLELGLIVDFALKENYNEQLDLSSDFVKWSIPKSYFPNTVSRFKARYLQYKVLWLLKKKFELESYDYVFISSYEEISFYFSNLKGNLLLLNHANIAALDNPIKRFFIKRISTYSKFIVFHEFIKEKCSSYGINNVQVEPLGLSEPYNLLDNSEKKSIIEIFDDQLILTDFDYMIFAPSGLKYGDVFLKQLICDEEFINFIDANKILFIIKDKNIELGNKNIFILKKHLSDSEYQAIFLASTFILLSYPNSFNYRISALLFECFSNNKPCLLSDIEGFKAFKDHFNYNPYFRYPNELIDILEVYIKVNKEQVIMPYKNLNLLNPKYINLI